MSIGNSNEEKKVLSKYNYYNLINGYKAPFLYRGSSNIERYITGTKLSELEALLNFDTNLRLLFLQKILKIEEIIKNQIVQSFYNYHLYEESSNTERDVQFTQR